MRLAPRGASGLKLEKKHDEAFCLCLAPRGASGLKYICKEAMPLDKMSGSARS